MAGITFAQAVAEYSEQNLLASMLSGYLNDSVTPIAVPQRVTAGAMAPGQTAKLFTGKVATSTTVITTVTLSTVTTGKTYYVTDMLISSDSAQGAATTVDVRLQAAGIDIFRGGVHNLAPITMSGIETSPLATTAQVVTLLLPITAGGVVNIWYNIYGYEQ